MQYNAAWMLERKLMHVMPEREAIKQLAERAEINDAYLGGEIARQYGKAGRGSPNKTPFVTAVEPDYAGRHRRIALQLLEGVTLAGIAAFAKQTLAPSRAVFNDGLNCFPGVIEADCSHTVCVTGGSRRAAEKRFYKWVHTTPGNIKSVLSGTYRHLDAGTPRATWLSSSTAAFAGSIWPACSHGCATFWSVPRPCPTLC